MYDFCLSFFKNKHNKKLKFQLSLIGKQRSWIIPRTIHHEISNENCDQAETSESEADEHTREEKATC